MILGAGRYQDAYRCREQGFPRISKEQGFPSLIGFKMLYYFINMALKCKEKPRGAAGKVH